MENAFPCNHHQLMRHSAETQQDGGWTLQIFHNLSNNSIDICKNKHVRIISKQRAKCSLNVGKGFKSLLLGV